MTNPLAVLALIKALTQEVNLLEQQLIALQNQQAIVATTTVNPYIPPYVPPSIQNPPLEIQPVFTAAPTSPSCTLVPSGSYYGSNTTMGLSWTSENEESQGILYDNYLGQQDGNNPIYQIVDSGLQPNGSDPSLVRFTHAKLVFADGTECDANL